MFLNISVNVNMFGTSAKRNLSVVKHYKGMHLSVGMSNETILKNIHWLVVLAVRVFSRTRCNLLTPICEWVFSYFK